MQFINKRDIILTLLIILFLLAMGFIASNWEKHSLYGMNPFNFLWLGIGIPIGIIIRWIEYKKGDGDKR